jgi:hypothetical protein
MTARSPRFPPGWWILPGLVLGPALWVGALILFGGAS